MYICVSVFVRVYVYVYIYVCVCVCSCLFETTDDILSVTYFLPLNLFQT